MPDTNDTKPCPGCGTQRYECKTVACDTTTAAQVIELWDAGLTTEPGEL